MIASDGLDKLYSDALSLPGGIRLSPQQLLGLADACLTRNTMIHTVEAFEIQSDAEVPRTDFSMYGPDDKLAGQLWNKRVGTSCNEARLVGQKAIVSGNTFVFLVWLDEE